MAINFPDSPSVNDTVTQGDLTWIWDGTVWKLTVATALAPAGSDHQVQFNDNSGFGADANFTYDGSTVNIKTPLNVGVDDTGHDVVFYGATTANGYAWWDESTDSFIVGPAGHLSFGETSPSWPVEFATDDDLTTRGS